MLQYVWYSSPDVMALVTLLCFHILNWSFRFANIGCWSSTIEFNSHISLMIRLSFSLPMPSSVSKILPILLLSFSPHSLSPPIYLSLTYTSISRLYLSIYLSIYPSISPIYLSLSLYQFNFRVFIGIGNICLHCHSK